MKTVDEGGSDSLATTILLAAIVLAGIWFWERHQSDALEEANAAAQDYSRDHLPGNCDAFAADSGGETLVIRCDARSTTEMKNALVPDRASAFDSFLLIGASGERLRCERGNPLDCRAPDDY